MCGTVAASKPSRSTGDLTYVRRGGAASSHWRTSSGRRRFPEPACSLSGCCRWALAGRDAAAAAPAGGRAGAAAGRVLLGGRLGLLGLLGLVGLGGRGRGPGGRRLVDRREVEQLAQQRAGRVHLVDGLVGQLETAPDQVDGLQLVPGREGDRDPGG